MKEKEKKRYEYGETTEECRYGLASIENCRRCLFETLCRLEKYKGKDIAEVEKTLEI